MTTKEGLFALLILLAKSISSTAFVCNDDFDCFPNGRCGSDLSCVCHSGFYGEQCEDTCPIHCQNGGQCVEIDEHGGFAPENDFYCDCPLGYFGGLCEKGTDSGKSTSSEQSAAVTIVSASLLSVILIMAGVYAINRCRRRRHSPVNPKAASSSRSSVKDAGKETAEPELEVELPRID